MNEHAVVLGIDCGGTHTDAVVCAGRHLLASAKVVMPRLKTGDMIVPGVEVVDVAKADTQQLNEGARRLISQIPSKLGSLVNTCVLTSNG